MTKRLFSFGSEQFDRIFPYHVLIDSKLKIISFGKSIGSTCSLKNDQELEDSFSIKFPLLENITFDSLKKITSEAVLLHFKGTSPAVFIGQFEFLEDKNQLLFIGAPRVNLVENVKESCLTGTGVTEHNTLTEQMTLLKEQQMASEINIKNQKKIEDQLKINEKRYRDLFNYSQAFICTHDLTGRLITVNPATCELMGYSQEEMAGRLISDFLPEGDVHDFHVDYLQKVINEGSAKGVFRILGRNRRKAYLLYKNFKVEEENSEPYIIGFSQDITDRIKTEKELLLTKKVTEDAHKAKETFLANMSHEIRTPMTGILGIANLMSKTRLDDQQKKFITLISESANNLLTIVNDVLDIEKIAARKLDLELIPFKIEDKVFTTLQSFQFKAEDKNINLTLRSSLPDDLVVIGDPYRLSQILNNLLSNALKFTINGEIAIVIDYKKNETNSIIIEIQVQDTGIGIKTEKLPDIFKPFMQGSVDTTRKYGGTGLGLTICKNLVEMQGGKINVVSRINEGTAFTFYIPYDKGDESMLTDENKNELNYKDLESIRILVAEDVDLNKFLVKHILESWGCDVTIASNGKEAVEKVKQQYFDLILMDIQMPEMDGITATDIIRHLNIGEKAVLDKSVITKKIRTLNIKDKSTIPIIAITANALKGDGQRYLSLGMNGYITKPYTEEKLFHAINQVIKTNDKLRVRLPLLVSSPGDNAEPTEKLYNLSMINDISKGDKEFTGKMISIFLETMPESLEKLIEAGQNKQYEQISRIAHKMKSQIDLMDISSLRTIIRELEATAPGYDNSGFLIEEVALTLNKVFDQLKQPV
jgi:PAS domain S-box-containing protein